MKKTSLIFALLFSAVAFGSSTRTLDGSAITNGSATLTLPTSTDTLVGKTTTDTLTNKTIEGSLNTLSLLPSQISGVVGVSKGGTGQPTITSGAVVLGQGTAGVSSVSPGTSGNVLSSNGTSWVSSTPTSTAPSITGSQASPSAVTAAGGVPFSGSNYQNAIFVSTASGNVTVTANPQVAAGSLVGQKFYIVGTSAANTVTLADGTGLNLNGPITLTNNSSLLLMWDGGVWTELARR